MKIFKKNDLKFNVNIDTKKAIAELKKIADQISKIRKSSKKLLKPELSVRQSILWFFMELVKRLSGIVLNMCRLAFLTWGLITWLWATGRIQLSGMDYIIFTLGIIGVKTWKKTKETMEIIKSNGSGKVKTISKKGLPKW